MKELSSCIFKKITEGFLSPSNKDSFDSKHTTFTEFPFESRTTSLPYFLPFLEVKTVADLIQPTILLTPNTQSLTPNTSYLFKEFCTLSKGFDIWNPKYSCSSTSLIVSLRLALQLEQVEEILRQEESKLVAATSTNEERLLRLNSFGYPLLAEEQVKLQKELTRQQNIRQLTETQTKAKTEIERLEKEVANCLKQLTEQETALKVTQRLYENARMAVGKDVKALRRQLQEGEACPVCGSTAHPYHQEQEVVDTLFRSIEQEYNVASTNYQQMNNRSIALQRDWTHQKTVDGQIAEQLAALYKAGIEAGNEEQIQHRLAELAIRILEYRNLYAEWQRSDEEIKKMRAHCEALRENVSLCRLAMQKVSSAKEQLVILQNAASAELKRFEVIEKALNVLRQERSQLLKGKSADEAEAAVAKREKELNLALEKARKEVEAVHNRLSGLQGEMKQIALAIGELQEQYKKIESPELLPEIIKKQQEENLNIERALSTMEACLLQQAKNKLTVEQIAKELAEKQTVAERWAKLNKLIGSADGAKFKVIAQSYTLNLLLLHANQHLSYLSKRYKLQQVPDTLALQVIDCDMCDEIRTVYSLSGGESFLISLALALGLSSLSSNNLKVESLFIDEGFGSLDAESLRTAMEALEQLQMQGRKIGVISHVQEMSERISVQVQVHKKVNGKSVLTVVG
jgi:exonuclease SbcC